MIKLLVVANPFPEMGGNYRAMKSLSEYPLYGIKPYLILPHIDSRSYNVNIISSLIVKGVEIVSNVRFSHRNIVIHRINALLYPIIPRVLLYVDLKNIPSDVDAVLSFHEVFEPLWSAQFIATKMRKPFIAILQLPPLYAHKHRLRALCSALKLYYYVCNKSGVKRVMAQLYRSVLDSIYSYKAKGIFYRYSFVIGISKSVCVEMNLESSSNVIV